MAEINAAEQYLLERTNAHRISLGLQPVAMHDVLLASSDQHTADLFASDQFNHGDPVALVSANGWQWRAGGYGWFENHQWSANYPGDLQAQVDVHFAGYLNSPSHRQNIENPNHEVAGMSFQAGEFAGFNQAYVSTEHFGWNEREAYLLGVAFDDLDGDMAYDIGEGLPGITVDVTDLLTGEITQATTNTAGGYQLELGAGSYRVEFEGGGGVLESRDLLLGEANVKLDFELDEALPPPPPPLTVLNGTKKNDSLIGTLGPDKIDGRGGRDTIRGDDGNDILTGGAGGDTFVFAPGDGNDRITDFAAGRNGDDVVRLQGVGITSFQQVLSQTVDTPQGALLAFTGGSVLFDGVSETRFHAGDFSFV